MRVARVVMACGLLAGFLAGCEGVITGSEIARVPLQVRDDGSFAPVVFRLSPEMNPVAVNLRADYTQDPAEFGKWNSYRATLRLAGSVVAARTFNVNHPAANRDDASPPPTQGIHTLFIVDVQSAGEYELAITPTAPVAIRLVEPHADARRNVQRPQQ